MRRGPRPRVSRPAWPGVFAVVAVVTVAGCGGSSSPAAPAPDYSGKTIQLGAVVSATGAGGIYGAQQKNGLQLAVDTINQSGGVFGARIALDVRDDASQQQQGVDAFKAQLETGKVLGIIGPSLTNTAVKAHPEANTNRTPVIAPSSTGEGIVGSCPYPCDYIFRDSLGEAIAIPDNVKAARDRYHPRSAVVFYATDDKPSVDGAGVFQQAFADNGISVPTGGLLTFAKADTGFADLVTAALAKKADLWALSTPAGSVPGLIAQARKQGYTGLLLGGDAFNRYTVAAQVGDPGKGAQSASGYFLGSDTGANKVFVAAYSARFKDDSGKPLQPDEVAAQAYAAVQLFAAAAGRAHLGFTDLAGDRTRLRDALAGVNVETPMGPFGFTSGHDVRQRVYIVAMDGKGGYNLLNTLQPQ